VGVTRLITVGDAPALAELHQANREFLAPWGPDHPSRYYTLEGQRRIVADALAQYRHGHGTVVPHVILCDGAVVGRVTISDIVRGAFGSCHLGYWVSQAHNGRGLATAAVGEMRSFAFQKLGLHRIQAGTLLHNARSQRVLERNRFVRIGVAPQYLMVAGQWQDHILYQVLSDEGAPEARGKPGALRDAGTPAAAAVIDGFYTVQRRFYAGEPVEGELAELMAPDIGWHVPGHNAIAGDYRGREDVLGYFRRRRDLADRSFVITPRGTLADATRVVHFADGEAVLGGETRRWRTVGIFEVAGRRIAECWLLPFDQAAFDAIWA
jgi:ribosomal-protein-alanine N-acetyltransferase